MDSHKESLSIFICIEREIERERVRFHIIYSVEVLTEVDPRQIIIRQPNPDETLILDSTRPHNNMCTNLYLRIDFIYE